MDPVSYLLCPDGETEAHSLSPGSSQTHQPHLEVSGFSHPYPTLLATPSTQIPARLLGKEHNDSKAADPRPHLASKSVENGAPRSAKDRGLCPTV